MEKVYSRSRLSQAFMETIDKLVSSGELSRDQARKLLATYNSAIVEAVQSVSASHNDQCLEATMKGAVDTYAGSQDDWYIAVKDSVISAKGDMRYNAGSVEISIQSKIE